MAATCSTRIAINMATTKDYMNVAHEILPKRTQDDWTVYGFASTLEEHVVQSVSAITDTDAEVIRDTIVEAVYITLVPDYIPACFMTSREKALTAIRRYKSVSRLIRTFTDKD